MLSNCCLSGSDSEIYYFVIGFTHSNLLNIQQNPRCPDFTLGSEVNNLQLQTQQKTLNLDFAVRSRFLAQALDAPSKFKKLLITDEVITHFLNSLCTSISCTIKSNPTADSRLKLSIRS